MAQRRMFSLKVTETDRFLEMGLTAQALYFHLGMAADDDGFVGNPKAIKRMVGASDDDLKLLVEKGYLLVFADGVIAIKDWLVSNCIKKDRYTPTIYSDDWQLIMVDQDKRYQIAPAKPIKNSGITPKDALATGSILDPQVSTGKTSKGEERRNEDNTSTTSSNSFSIFYQSLPTNALKKELMQFVSELGLDVVAFALNSMYENAEKPSFRYLRAILLRFKRQGIKTLQAAQHDQDVFAGKVPIKDGRPPIPLYKLQD